MGDTYSKGSSSRRSGVAMMSKAFVINAVGTVSDEMIEILAANDDDRAFLRDPDCSGGSTIIDPQSDVIAGTLSHEEGILYADIDLEACVRAKVIHDLSGHYNRADIFNVRVNKTAPSLYRSHRTPCEDATDDDAATTPTGERHAAEDPSGSRSVADPSRPVGALSASLLDSMPALQKAIRTE
jgi:hypothetical protein